MHNPVFAGYAAIDLQIEEIEDDEFYCYINFDVVDPDGTKLNKHPLGVRVYRYDHDEAYDAIERKVISEAKRDYLNSRKTVRI